MLRTRLEERLKEGKREARNEQHGALTLPLCVTFVLEERMKWVKQRILIAFTLQLFTNGGGATYASAHSPRDVAILYSHSMC
jgi:hypothetical protein